MTRLAGAFAALLIFVSVMGCDPKHPQNDSPREIGIWMLSKVYHEGDQWNCLNLLWTAESDWQITAQNPVSGAYGIPQALPGDKMSSVYWNWQTSAWTQIKWGIDYINARYGGPCGAWTHELAFSWY